MKRLFVAVVVACIGLANMVTPATADTNDFTIKSFDADYYLARDREKRSTLRTVERITAQFPNFDQNHGIERALPLRYDGHSTDLSVQSVTDGSGQPQNYMTHESGGNLVLRIGDANWYVQGEQTYVITYTQRDVTRFFANTDSDEFYWDINGTQWAQSFGDVSARVHVDKALRDSLTGNTACYYGLSGSTQMCNATMDDGVLTANVAGLGPAENTTVSIGFKPQTFAPYEPTLFEKIITVVMAVWFVILAVSSIIAVVLIAILIIRYYTWNNRKKDTGTIVPEYTPPRNASVLISSQIADGTRGAMTAQILDLAVRHYLKIYQTQDSSFLKTAEYELEIIKPIDDLSEEEQNFIKTLFDANGTDVGGRFAMKQLKNDYVMASKISAGTTDLSKKIRGEYNLRHRLTSQTKWFRRIGIVTLIFSIVAVSPLLFVASLVAFVCARSLYPLTDTGLALRRYLAGLKLYIGVAETERLAMLQSPEGAEKVGAGAADSPEKLVKLYERVLPYATLFGQEKEWSKQLGAYYEQNGTSPDWYSSHAAFNAAVFSGALSDFGSTTNSYMVSTSSSSGGSSGGGSSGGGGGGGGGGGW